MTKYFHLSGSGDEVNCNSLEEAIETASSWYDYLDDRFYQERENYDATQRPQLNQEGIETLDDLLNAVSAWESKLAEFCGYEDVSGHGNYFVSSTSAGGFSLSITEKDTEEDNEEG